MILALDEASLYLQATTMAVWAPRGQAPRVRIDASRRKINFYGALNLATGEELAWSTETMNAAHTVTYLERLVARWPERPLLILWDRAPWHRGAALREFLLGHPRLETLWLPVAAPELNPQEQVWKATRRAVSHNHQQKDMATLTQRFEQHLNENTFPSTLLETHDYPRLCAMFK